MSSVAEAFGNNAGDFCFVRVWSIICGIGGGIKVQNRNTMMTRTRVSLEPSYSSTTADSIGNQETFANMSRAAEIEFVRL